MDTPSDILAEEQHPVSKRRALLEDDGNAAYLYLTEPNSFEPVRDSWVFNRVPAPEWEDIDNYQEGPPPACQGYASSTSLLTDPAKLAIRLVWSWNGKSVSVWINEIPTACASLNLERGMCRNLVMPGPWGIPWNKELYLEMFDNPPTA